MRPPSHQITLHAWQTPSVGRFLVLVVPAYSGPPAASGGFQAKFETQTRCLRLSEVSYLAPLASPLTFTYSFQSEDEGRDAMSAAPR